MNTSPQIASHLLRSRIGKVCVAITGSSPEEMLSRAADVLKETAFLEFRLDYLSKPAAAMAGIKEFLAEHTAATAIATCRCEVNGGKFKGSTTEAVDVLFKAADAGFHMVDLELESIEKLPRETVDKLRATGVALIVSFHDFQGTRDLDGVLARMTPFAPEFYKIVPTAKNLSDNLTMMRFLEKTEEQYNSSMVGICMGEAGISSRILGLRSGSAFTFAAATAGEETASGQISARTLIETYRIDQVDVATKVYGVAGNPIKNSLSPLMMNTAFRRETVNAVYLALQTSKAEDLFRLVREIPLQGLSVTMPLKQDIIPLLERTDALSTKIGAVNTVFRAQDGKFYGFNTDVAGIIQPLERRMTLSGARVLVLGAGGVARAAVFGLKDKGADVSILNRTPETAQKLAKQAGAKVIKREAVAKAGFDVVINCTPYGMNGVKATPLLQPEDLTCKLLFDTVYNPLETPLLRLARQKGIAIITGIEMFVQQGARQFEIWTGKPAPEDEMLRVVLHSLRQAAEAAGEAPAPPITVTKVATGSVPAADTGSQEEANETDEPSSAQQTAAAPAKAAGTKQTPAKAVPAKTVLAKAVPAVKPTAPAKTAGAKPAPAKPSAKTAAPAKGPAKAAAKKTATKEKKSR